VGSANNLYTDTKENSYRVYAKQTFWNFERSCLGMATEEVLVPDHLLLGVVPVASFEVKEDL
jgi:hypothetical protein